LVGIDKRGGRGPLEGENEDDGEEVVKNPTAATRKRSGLVPVQNLQCWQAR